MSGIVLADHQSVVRRVLRGRFVPKPPEPWGLLRSSTNSNFPLSLSLGWRGPIASDQTQRELSNP